MQKIKNEIHLLVERITDERLLRRIWKILLHAIR